MEEPAAAEEDEEEEIAKPRRLNRLRDIREEDEDHDTGKKD